MRFRGGEVGGGRAFVHEDHVDVGCVRQLGAAEPAEADHREGQRRFERAQRGFDARVGEARELASGRVELREAEHVARADAQEMAPLEAAEPGAPPRVVLAPVERVECFLDELVTGRLRCERRVVGQCVDEVGLAVERHPETRRAEDAARAFGGDR